MRTGKGRKFVIDEEKLAKTEARRKEGAGLFGGDIDRVPHPRRGLRPYIELEDVPEVVRTCEDPELLEEQQAFLAHRPLEVEVGFGGGASIFNRAKSRPDTHFVGFEIRLHLCLSLVKRIARDNVPNLRVCYEDVRQSMPPMIADQSLRRCSVFFPDPWWKRRHIKRRLLTTSFLDLMEQKLLPDGVLHIKTDVEEYSHVIEELLESDGRYIKADASFDHLFADDHPTEREAFCLQEGIPFWQFRYVLKP